MISFSNISIRGFAIFHKKCIHRSKKIISIVEKGVYILGNGSHLERVIPFSSICSDEFSVNLTELDGRRRKRTGFSIGSKLVERCPVSSFSAFLVPRFSTPSDPILEIDCSKAILRSAVIDSPLLQLEISSRAPRTPLIF